MTDRSSIRFGSVTVPSEAPSPGPSPAGSWPRRVPRIEQRWARWRSSLRTHALRHRDRSRNLPPRGARAPSRPAPEHRSHRAADASPLLNGSRPGHRERGLTGPAPSLGSHEERAGRGPALRIAPWLPARSAMHRLPPRFDTRSCILPQSTWTLVSQSRAVVTSSIPNQASPSVASS